MKTKQCRYLLIIKRKNGKIICINDIDIDMVCTNTKSFYQRMILFSLKLSTLITITCQYI